MTKRPEVLSKSHNSKVTKWIYLIRVFCHGVIVTCMFQSRPLRLYYSVFDGPEVPLPEDNLMERFTRSRGSTLPIDHPLPLGRLNRLPVGPDVKPTFGVDVKPPPFLDDSAANYFRSRSETGSGRKRPRRRSSDDGIATGKRIKQENTTDAVSPGHVTVTSPRLSPPTTTRGGPPGGGGALSLPVTISKDFIKELVVSRALAKDGPAAGRMRVDNSEASRGVGPSSMSPISGQTPSGP